MTKQFYTEVILDRIEQEDGLTISTMLQRLQEMQVKYGPNAVVSVYNESECLEIWPPEQED